MVHTTTSTAADAYAATQGVLTMHTCTCYTFMDNYEQQSGKVLELMSACVYARVCARMYVHLHTTKQCTHKLKQQNDSIK